MMATGISEITRARLNILRDHGLLESVARPAFDNVVLLAAQLCDTPLATFSVNDVSRQRFVACHGCTLDYLPLGKGYAQFIVSGGAPLLVNDARNEPRFRDPPLCKALPELRFYAGVPVTSPNGVVIGTLAVMDTVTRHLPHKKLQALATLAEQLITHLELERRIRPRRAAKISANGVDFHALFDALPGIQWVVEPDEFRFVAVNDDFLEATMTRREDLIGKRLFDVFIGDPNIRNNANVLALQASLERVKQLEQSDRISLLHYPILRPSRKGGGYEDRYWSTHSLPVFDAERRLQYILNHTEDITGFMRLHAGAKEKPSNLTTSELHTARLGTEILRHAGELERVNQHLAMAQQVAGIGSWEYRIADGSRRWSDEVYRITGLSRNEYPEGEQAIRAAVHPDDLPLLLAERERALQGKGPMELTHRIVRPDGSIRYVREKARMLSGDDGSPAILYGTLQDVTDQKLVELEIDMRARRQLTVAQLGQLALENTRLDDLFQETIDIVREVLDVDIGGVFSLSDKHELELVAGSGWDDDLVGHATLAVSRRSRIAKAMHSGAPLVIEDMRAAGARRIAPLLRQHGVTSSAMVVVADREWTPWGILAVYSTLRRKFNDEDIHFLQSVANILSGAIQRIRTGDELSMQARQQAAVAALGWEALRSADLPRLQQLAAEQVAQTFGLEYCKVLELLPDGSGLKLVAGVGWQKGLVGHAVLGTGRRSHGGYTLATDNPVVFENLDEETRFRPPLMFREHNVVSGIAVTIAGENGPWGVLGAQSTRPRKFTQDDVNFIQNMANVLSEVTQRVQADVLIRKSEERFRIVARATADTIWDWNLTTGKLWWNDGMYTVFGYELGEVETDSRSWTNRIHPDDKERVLENVRQTMASDTNSWSEEYRFMRKDGSIAFVTDQGFVIRDDSGKAVRMIGGMNDVTEKKEYEAKLRQQAALLDKAQDAIMVYGVDCRVRYWNRSAERLYGWSAVEAAGQSVRTLLYADPAAFDAAMKSLLDNGEWTGEIRQQRQDGNTLTVEGAWTLVRDEDGEPQYVLAINTDMTERLALQEQLSQSQRLESIGQLTGGVAHDFNNLLTVILGNSELLTEQLDAQPRLRGLAEMTKDAARRGAALTQRLLAFARRQALEPKATDINRLVADMNDLLKRTLPENIELEIDGQARLWNALIDPAQLEAALLNLAINAKDAMPDGGRLIIETSNIHLDEDYAAQNAEVSSGNYVLIAISDTGTGIAAENIEQVFDPFFTTKEKGRGTGLGLSMTYGFIKQSRGHIKLYSEPGQGTTVKLYLPKADRPAAVAAATSAVKPDYSGTEKILLVEDNDLVREHAESQLAAFGYRVIAASNGPEALQVIEREKDIDLLFTDVIMSGGMNGRELAATATRLRPRLKVLYASGYTENAIVHHGQLDSGVHLLQKPYQRADLARKVRQALTEPSPGSDA